jgi:hypothetical protein
MKGDFHVRFRENVGVKFPRVTRLCPSETAASINGNGNFHLCTCQRMTLTHAVVGR